ncbi:hypothetical protein Bca101_058623 [Brassica carinata]
MGCEDNCTKFTLEVEGKKIIGFHGSAAYNLFGLGAYFDRVPSTRMEAKGRDGGKEWDDGSEHEAISKIQVQGDSHGIQNIKIDYSKDGHQKDGPIHGFSDGGRTSPAFGGVSEDDNSKFVLKRNGCALVGFDALYYTSNLVALGAYCLPPRSHSEKLEAQGGAGGASWDDVKFVYDKDTQVIFGDDHGNKTMTKLEEFELEYPNEYITSVQGSYDKVTGSESEVILMLKFTTNKRTSQVFGVDTTSNFLLHKDGYKIVGFHGKSGNMLHRIGVHVMPISHNRHH